MRLWSLHPKYLDTKGLLAVWREGLLAQKVLAGKTKGYTQHPQLIRFRKSTKPESLIAYYLHEVHQEATTRGYVFDKSKIIQRFRDEKLTVTAGQIQYEWKHLLLKLHKRDKRRYLELADITSPEVHPMFQIVEGQVEEWEKIQKRITRNKPNR